MITTYRVNVCIILYHVWTDSKGIMSYDLPIHDMKNFCIKYCEKEWSTEFGYFDFMSKNDEFFFSIVWL